MGLCLQQQTQYQMDSGRIMVIKNNFQSINSLPNKDDSSSEGTTIAWNICYDLRTDTDVHNDQECNQIHRS